MSLAESDFYIQVPGREATEFLSQLSIPSDSNDTSTLTNCQRALLKLTCDYYYPPCDPVTFDQRAICDDSCDSVSFIKQYCSTEDIVGNAEVLNDVINLNCSDPSSYLIRNVTVSQDQCIDLLPYSRFALA